MSTLSLFCFQLDIIWENPSANYTGVLRMLEEAAPPAGSLVALPEMFSSGFSMNVEKTADDKRATQMFLAAAAAKFEVCLLAGIVTRGENGKGRNQVLVVGPDGKEIARYCKIHPFTFSGESNHYEAGGEVLVFEWQGWKIAPFVCYDLRFPEVFREAVRQGAELFIVPANWPSAREMHWMTLLQARAIENQAYVAGINRCGSDPNLEYPGRSIIINPRGEILADAGEKEVSINALLEQEELREYRRQFPVLADMRF